MKKRMGTIFALGLLASLASLQAAIIPCANTTLSALIALGSGLGNGCQIDDKLFNNFSYTASLGAPFSPFVNANLDASASTLTYGWSFTSATGSFQGNFSLGYTVTIVTSGAGSCSLCLITSASEQLFAGSGPPSTVNISVGEGANPTPVVINNTGFGTNTNGTFISPGVLSLTKTVSATGIDSASPLLSFESFVRQTQGSTVPEPAAFSLIGIGLIGLGFLRRRQ